MQTERATARIAMRLMAILIDVCIFEGVLPKVTALKADLEFETVRMAQKHNVEQYIDQAPDLLAKTDGNEQPKMKVLEGLGVGVYMYPEGSLFLTLAGKRTISTRAIQARLSKLSIEAGIAPEKQHPHVLRRAFATRMLFDTETIGGIYTVSKLLGHSRVAVTEMYLHCSQDQLEQALLADPLAVGV